ncbi:MAG: ABC transporter ATP-binding protein [Halobacteriaceae archaeon]
MAAVRAREVTKRYGETTALDGVSLSIERGELFALIGPNGAGKTTLVRCLTGTTDHGGEAELLGESPRAVDRSRVGLLPQSFAPASRLTARELVGYYAGLYDDARDPGDALAEVGLDAAGADTRYERLSGGQQRRACVAAALVNDPAVLFLDEPTVGIDPAGRRAIRDVVEALADAGTTVVLTTHDMAEAERLADRVGLLAGGELVATGTPAELVAAHGGESSLRVETEADPGVLLAAGFEARTTADGIEVAGIDPRDIGEVARALDEAGVAYGAIEWREPDLEDAYIALAGGKESGGPAADGHPPDRRTGSGGGEA